MSWWARMWDLKEAPHSLALLRITVGAVMAGELAWAGYVGVVDWLWAPAEAGGLQDVMAMNRLPLVYQVLPPQAWSAWLVWGVALVAAVCMTVGFFSRASVLVTLLISAQLALINVPADRGIELVLRDLLLILCFARCGAAWSVDARLETGRWGGDGSLVPAWPRHLVVLQLIVIYQVAGISKFSSVWWPDGDYLALYYVLENPIYSRFDLNWAAPPLLQLSQLGSALTMVFEWSAWILLPAYWFRFTHDRPGRLRALFNRLDLRRVYVFGGIALHLGIEVLMSLGAFALAMLAVYPAFFHPDELQSAGRRLRGLVRR